MSKSRRSKPGSSPAVLMPHLVDGVGRKPVIRLIEFDETHLEEKEIDNVTDVISRLANGKVTWINIDGLGDIEALQELGKLFNLHPLTLEDVLNTGQRPKIEPHDDHVFIVAQMVYHDKKLHICGEQVSFFVGEHFLITVQEEAEYDVFDPVRTRIRAGRGNIRKSGPDYLAYALLDSIIDHYYPVLESIGNAIEDVEDDLLNKPTREMVEIIHHCRRNLTQLRRFVWPTRDVVSGLLHDSTGLFKDTTKVFMRDCYDHTVQIMDLVESYKDITNGLMDIYHSSLGLRTNEIMRVLTVITSIFIPLTFVVGIYGMNFAPQSLTGEQMPLNMPELYHPHGYIWIIGIMGTIALIQLAIFKKMKWL